MSINNAFNALINLKGKVMTLVKVVDASEIQVLMANSNYFRNFAGPEEITVEGLEFVISKDSLNGYKPIKGDRIVDPDYGDNTIKEVRPLSGLKSEVVGYRVRTS